MQAFGGLAALGWPIALTLVGASLANTGLNIDQAVDGKTAAQRKAGVLGAINNIIYLLFNLPLLMSLRAVSQPVPVAATEGLPISSEVLESSSAPAHPLENMEGNLLLDSLTPSAAEGRFRGIYTLGNGETRIKLAQLPYRVMFNEQQQCWLIVNPDNPFAFAGSKPVRLSTDGEWALLDSPGLQGGAPMDVPMPSSSASTATGKPLCDRALGLLGQVSANGSVQ